MSGSVTILTERRDHEIGIVKAMFVSRPNGTVVINFPANENSECPQPEIMDRETFFRGVMERYDGTVDTMAIRGR